MADDTTAQVRITADATGVQAGVDQAKGSIEGLSPFIEETRANFATMGAQVDEAKAQFAGFGSAASSALASVATATEATGAAVSGMVMKVHGAAESVRTFQMRAKEFAELYVAVFALDQIKDVIEGLTEASTKYTSEVERLSKTFGMSLHEADGYHAMLNKLGISTDAVTGQVQKMDRQMRQHEDAFNRLGVATRDANGHLREQRDIYMDALDVLRNYAEGTDRNMAAQILFGRGAGDLTETLRQNRQEMEEGKKTAEALNLQTTGEGVAAMHEYREAVAEASETWDSFKIQLGHELIPTLLSLARWFRSDGPSAIKDTISNIDEFIAEIKTIPAIWNFVSASLDLALAGWEGFFEKITLWLSTLEEKIILFGEVSGLALQGHISEAEQIWEAALKQIGDAADRESARIVHAANTATAAWEKARAEMSHALNPVDVGDTLFRDEKGRIDPDEYPMDLGAPPKDPTTGDGNRLDDIKQAHAPKEKKGKSRLDDWDAALADQQRAFAIQMQQQDSFQEWSASSTAAYWASILRLDNLSTEERKGATDKWLEADKQARKEAFNAQIGDLQRKAAADKYNSQQEIADLTNIANLVKQKYTERSAEYARAMEKIQEARERATQQEIQREEQVAAVQRQAALDAIAFDEQAAQHRVAMGRETNAELLQEQIGFEQRKHQALVNAIQADIAAESLDPERNAQKLRQLHAELEAEWRRYYATIAKIQQQQESERTKVERQAIGQLSQSWGQALGQLVTLQASVTTTIKSLWQGLQQAIGNAIASIIEQWLTKHLSALVIGGAASKTAALAQIGDQAAIAGASGTASYAAAPWPIDMGAPAFGASMAAAAAGFGSLISAEGGAWTVPGGPAILHPEEMVLPAWAAKPLRAMISGAANNNAPSPANDGGGASGGHQFHYHDHTGTLTPAQIRANKSAFVDMMAEAHRSGAFTRKMR